MLDVRMRAALAAGGIVIAAAACASETPSATTTSTARPQQSIVVPDLVGLTWPDAERRLRGVGWSGTIVKMPNATGAEQSSGGIVAQDPAPGTSVGAGSPITVQFNG
jgi:serine/threonine-protein kinase